MKNSKQKIVSAVVIVIVLAIGVYASFSLQQRPKLSYVAAKNSDISQGVKTDGVVQAAQDLSLSFEQGGTVSQVNVKAGDVVKKGQVLVALNNGDTSAGVSQAAAALSLAQANYNKLLSGDTSADVDVAKAAVTSAQTALSNAQKNQIAITSQQNLAVKNAYNALVNSGVAAIAATGNNSSINPTITGSYSGANQGAYQIKIFSTGSGLMLNITGLETLTAQYSTAPVALGTMGLFIQFPIGTVYPGDSWTVNLPNTQASTYLANNNAYQAALQTQNQTMVSAQSAVDSAQAALSQAQAALQLKQTAARPEDVAAANAQVATASAALQAARNNLNKGQLIAPTDGIVTLVNAKVGQTVSGSALAPSPAAVAMISNAKFQVMAYVSETDIGKIKVGDISHVTLDAYGVGVDFPATVISIDPAATVNSGVSTYKTTLEFNQDDDRIRSGMGATASIVDTTQANALVIPASAVFKNNGQSFVLTVSGNGKIMQTPIQTGVVSLDGYVQVMSGLQTGQQVAYFGNNN